MIRILQIIKIVFKKIVFKNVRNSNLIGAMGIILAPGSPVKILLQVLYILGSI